MFAGPIRVTSDSCHYVMLWLEYHLKIIGW
jgi:hypothetical protein